MNTNTEKATIPTKGNIAIYLRYPKVPKVSSDLITMLTF